VHVECSVPTVYFESSLPTAARKRSQITAFKMYQFSLSCQNVNFVRSLVPFPASFLDWWTNLNSNHLPMIGWFQLLRSNLVVSSCSDAESHTREWSGLSGSVLT
jgi:hypothetical protein